MGNDSLDGMLTGSNNSGQQSARSEENSSQHRSGSEDYSVARACIVPLVGVTTGLAALVWTAVRHATHGATAESSPSDGFLLVYGILAPVLSLSYGFLYDIQKNPECYPADPLPPGADGFD